MMIQRGSHCNYCGILTDIPKLGRPVKCPVCEEVLYDHLVPRIAVVQPVIFEPVTISVVSVRRIVPPAIGQLALPDGYLEHADDWRRSAQAILKRQTGIEQPLEALQPLFWRTNLFQRSLILVCCCPPLRVFELKPQVVTANSDGTIEVSERLILSEVETLAFDVHRAAAEEVITTVQATRTLKAPIRR